MITQEQLDARTLKYDRCWIWTGSTNGKNGRGIAWDREGKRKVVASRAAWELANGPIPSGMMVCHTCDNPKCVRPSHLFLGTQSDNMKDAGAKHRHGLQRHPELSRGERNNSCVLTVEDVHTIRERYSQGASFYRLGKDFSVDPVTIRNIVRGKTWAWLPQRQP